ncbi:MAG: leucine-rich repeat domain-containing protein [Chlamydiota bacterium]
MSICSTEKKHAPTLEEQMSHLTLEGPSLAKPKKICAKFCILPPIPSISALYSLRRLDVTHCNLKTIPSGIGNLPKLRSIDVSHNDLESLPTEIFTAPALKTLKANDNALCTPIPLSLLKNSTLTTLELHHNPLQPEHFPTAEQLKRSPLKLKRLVVDDHIPRARNNLSPLPLKKNRHLISIPQASKTHSERAFTPMQSTSIDPVKIQVDLFETSHPTTLAPAIYEHVLSYLPGNIVIQNAAHLSALEPIQLSNVTHMIIKEHPRLERLLPKIQKCVNLNVLILQNCKLHTLSRAFFAKMTKLSYLDLSNNNLSRVSALPPSLKICHLDNNRITHLPKLPEGLISLTMNRNILGMEGSFTFTFPSSLKVLELEHNCILFEEFFSQRLNPLNHLNLTTLKMDLKAVQNRHKEIYQPITMQASYDAAYNTTTDLDWLGYIQTTPAFKNHSTDPLIQKKIWN